MSDELRSRLSAVEGQADHEDAVKRRETPKGWEAGVVWEGTSGTVTTGAIDNPPEDWSDLLSERGLDPERYEIVGDTVKWTSWDGWRRDEGGETYSALCYSFRADIRLRNSHPFLPEEIYLDALKARPAKKAPAGGPATFVLLLSDWQVGNRDGGGVERQMRAIAAIPELMKERVKALRKAGVEIGAITLLGMGDLGEGTCNFYPAQPFRVELDRREQQKVVRRGLRDIVMAAAPLAPQVLVAAVPGNHGENRNNGKSITDPGDNDDVSVFEQVAEILSVNPDAFGHVGFRLPLEQIALSVELSGHIVAITHGHVPKMRGEATSTLWNWWREHAHGRACPGLADADILLAGHFHHFNAKEQEGRTLFIAPSLTPVGNYFQDAHGVRTQPGSLSFVLDDNGWRDLAILA